MGEEQEMSPGVQVRVTIDSVGGDGQQAWLNVMVDHANNTGRNLPPTAPTLHCAGSDNAGQAREPDFSLGGSGGSMVELLLPRDATGAPLKKCSPPAYVAIGRARWTLADYEVKYLNEELARDPGRPYSWTATDGAFSSGYQVVVVPAMTAAEALAVLGPSTREVSQERFWAIRVAEHDGAVVLFTWGVLEDDKVVALSRIGGLAASYGNTVNGDDHVLVAREGRVVRSFDPFLQQDFLKAKHLPQEKGLDLENDTGPASWTLLERLTKVHITRDWLMDEDHPAYLVK